MEFMREQTQMLTNKDRQESHPTATPQANVFSKIKRNSINAITQVLLRLRIKENYTLYYEEK